MTAKRIPAATIRRAWQDTSQSITECAEALGISRATLIRRAKLHGLPPRTNGRGPAIVGNEFKAMWRAGVYARDLAAHYECHHMTVCNTARRLNLPRRTNLRAHMTLEQYHASKSLAESLWAKSARETAEMMRHCELVDGVRRDGRG